MTESAAVERDEMVVIAPTFDELVRRAEPDPSRPSIEHYRRRDEIDLLLPIA
jgi:hypothetical protein